MIYVYDTNIVSWIMERDQPLLKRISNELKLGDVILGCPVVWHEIRRGLLARNALVKLQLFEAIYASFLWKDYERPDWELASTLWASRRTQGMPISDADLLIAAFARNRNAVLITDNEKDFQHLGLKIENWKR